MDTNIIIIIIYNIILYNNYYIYKRNALANSTERGSLARPMYRIFKMLPCMGSARDTV